MIKKIILSVALIAGAITCCMAAEEPRAMDAQISFNWLPGKSFSVAEVKAWSIEEIYSELELATKFEAYMLQMASVRAQCRKVNATKVLFDPTEGGEIANGMVMELLLSISDVAFIGSSPILILLAEIIFRRINVYSLSSISDMKRAKEECYKIGEEDRKRYSARNGSGEACSVCFDQKAPTAGLRGKSIVSLPCFHDFCSDCVLVLLARASESGGVKCPLCRTFSDPEEVRKRWERCLRLTRLAAQSAK